MVCAHGAVRGLHESSLIPKSGGRAFPNLLCRSPQSQFRRGKLTFDEMGRTPPCGPEIRQKTDHAILNRSRCLSSRRMRDWNVITRVADSSSSTVHGGWAGDPSEPPHPKPQTKNPNPEPEWARDRESDGRNPEP